MLTVSLHGIKLHSQLGLYEQEQVLGNDFEVDVDVWLETSSAQPWPFVDYAVIRDIVEKVFARPGLLIETFVQEVHTTLKQQFPDAAKLRVAVRKYHPPMPGEVHYAQVCFEG
jgi:dihydroneopterin aldolase